VLKAMEPVIAYGHADGGAASFKAGKSDRAGKSARASGAKGKRR
jgi:hypothetical protein